MSDNKKMTRLEHRQKALADKWDAIIIGSGISGLSTGAILALHGKKVLILEQHYQVGGFTHTFRRKEFEWDTGIHYLGAVTKRSWHNQLRALTEGRIDFEPFDGINDTIYFPGMKIDMPGDFEKYKEVLAEQFPDEKEGISHYLDAVKECRLLMSKLFMINLLPKVLTFILRHTLFRKQYYYATRTTEQIMSKYIKNSKLKDILDVQWGNIGMPRQRCSFMVHASMLGVYLEGAATYPKRGSTIFAKELGKTIENHGGTILIKTSVAKIITEKNEAIGVEVESGEKVYGKYILSSAGVHNTYGKFLKGHSSIDKEFKKIKEIGLSYEYLNLYFGMKSDPRKLGLGKENYWIARRWATKESELFWDLDDLETEGQPDVMFLNFASLRDPHFNENGKDGHCGQIIFYGTQRYFDKWKDTEWQKRGEEYEKLKQKLTDLLLKAVDKTIPGLSKEITYTEIATPLSYIKFSGHPRGIPYGVAPVPKRYQSYLLRPQTPIKHLYLIGQDMIQIGVAAAFGSISLATSLILKRNIRSWLREKGTEFAPE